MKSWKTVSLGEACEIIKRGITPTYLEDGGICVVNQKCIRRHTINMLLTRRHNIDRKMVPPERFIRLGDVLVNSTGTGTLGRVAQVRQEPSEPTTVDTHVTIVRPYPNKFHNDFFGYMLIKIEEEIANSGEGSSGQTELSRRKLAEGFQVSYPNSIREQRRIAAILDKADAVRRKRKEAIALAEDLLRSAFLEMFGDPVINPKGWDVAPLGEVAKIQGGLQVTKKRKDNPLEVPYLRVANVYRDRLSLDEIKTIRVRDSELQRTKLMIGDLLIVEGHGNRDEIGRSSVWDGSIPNCTHQNHLIRVRVNVGTVDPTYVSAYLNSAGGRRQLKRFGKTTSGLNTISASNVRATNVLIPPLTEQKKYLEIKQHISKAITCEERNQKHSEALFNSLLQRAFRGDL